MNRLRADEAAPDDSSQAERAGSKQRKRAGLRSDSRTRGHHLDGDLFRSSAGPSGVEGRIHLVAHIGEVEKGYVQSCGIKEANAGLVDEELASARGEEKKVVVRRGECGGKGARRKQSDRRAIHGPGNPGHEI